MKKIFLSLAILATTVAAFASNDNNKSANPGNCPATEQECCKPNGERPEGKEFKGKKGGEARLFEGITLTDDQKAKFKALREKNKAEREKAKAERKKAKEERQAKKRDDQKNRLNDIKEILTADQYVVFLENSYLMNQNRPKPEMKGGPGRGGERFEMDGPRPGDDREPRGDMKRMPKDGKQKKDRKAPAPEKSEE